MAYMGSYPKEINPFLRNALKNAYQSRRFHGGRGFMYSGNIDGKHYRYENESYPDTIWEFHGSETIFERKWTDREVEDRVGGCTFFGGSMI
ncbi:MAG: hypothetical protein CEN90_263 [Parcubacteria group bacterium Licking1014_17]|nr:MAG: hypothetical protein CEN90_263 [Parcubacteria group bacterium Licking1014_17]